MSLSDILLVDDEPMVLSSLTRLLEDDYNVHSAENGMKAIELARHHPIKVVISDQRMPGMLGHEVLREIKLLSPNTIRMLLTGYSDLDAVISSVNSGEIFRYINKPWRADNLMSLVKLGVQIYDQINRLQSQQMSKPVSATGAATLNTGATASAATVKHSVHIEVDEKHGNVLFVDYSADEVKKLTDKFGRTFDVTGATSIDEAFKELARKPVSVVVSNVNFGDVDGIAFLNTIKEEYPHIVTVILTEIKDATLAVRSINELNVFKYLIKPAGDEVIEKTITDAVDKNKRYAAAPLQNTRYAAAVIAPEAKPAPKPDESELRLRLRAAQALLAKRQ